MGEAMPSPAEMRLERLKSDWESMVRIRGPVVDWKALSGQDKYVDDYALTIRVRSITGPAPNFRDTHNFRITLPGDYPTASPDISSTDNPIPFNPNFFKTGRWCLGTWAETDTLGKTVLRMVRTLQFDPKLINVRSPANSDARAWYDRQAGSGLFPTDRQLLPNPEGMRIRVRTR